MTKERKMSNYRWIICGMLFLATAVNYMDRQVLSLTWKDFIAPDFNWSDADYGKITGTFALIYAIANIFMGRIVDWLGSRKGYLLAIFVWSIGACLHALCGVATTGYMNLMHVTGDTVVMVTTVSVWFFISARTILAIGEAGNFPAAIKVTAEYFPKRDRAFATSIFNAGSQIGPMIAPFTIPLLARYFGWEMAFIVIGALGFVWMGFWVFMYKKPENNPKVNDEELSYIKSDEKEAEVEEQNVPEKGLSIWKCLHFRQTWALILGRFTTDGVWWFFLFWIPAYLSDVYGYTSDSPKAMFMIIVLYAITMLSLYGGKLPSIMMARSGGNPYNTRMKAMFIYACVPLLALFAQPLGQFSAWWPIVIIGIAAAAHQSWSANIYSVVSDMFPRSAVGTVVGLSSAASGISSALFNYGSGFLFRYADAVQLHFCGFEGKPAGYFIMFSICGVAYIVGWSLMKIMVPHYKLVKI